MARNSYWPCYIDQIKAFFHDYINITQLNDEEWYLESTQNLDIVDWTIPVGVLYDTLNIAGLFKTRLRCTDVPVTLLPRSRNGVQAQWLQRLKESGFLRYNSVSAVMGLEKKDIEGMWEAISANDGESFAKRRAKIRASTHNFPGKIYTKQLSQCIRIPLAFTVGDLQEKYHCPGYISQGIVLDSTWKFQDIFPFLMSGDGFVHLVSFSAPVS
ncbi:hypothetical protein CANCADRAFT_1404 [Tortispora caseinolytica NRRL Y-17796]|uniref:Uncharacterized protein n=1 Tax=Tortispora caseinolytica NRRL Y-17796 TaxID=767744 RepID=A0A1E4TM21_9ASCO|nr:hypothetical protein CANCADRAFT_1404 [Tortispora caseinolytica NRRL Y-17796]